MRLLGLISKLYVHILCQHNSPLVSCLMQCLFPMQHIRSNSQRVSVALKSLATEAQSLTRSSSSSLPDSCLVDGLQEALLQFHRLTQNSKQVNDVILCYIQ